MATAAKLIETLAAELGWSTATVEAYALELRREGWWPKTKRGRGASSVTTMDAAKLLLAVLSDGPKSLARSETGPLPHSHRLGFFLTSATLCNLMPNSWEYAVLCDELNLTQKADFLDFVAAVLQTFVDGRAVGIFSRMGGEFTPKWRYSGPEVSFTIYGPEPAGTMNFYFSDSLADELVSKGLDSEKVRRKQQLVFGHLLHGWREKYRQLGENVGVMDELLLALEEDSAKGLRRTKTFGGQELTACARVLAEDAK